MSKRKKRKRMRQKERYEQKEKKRQEEEKQTLPAEFNDIVDDIVDKVLNPADDLPEGFIIEYEINNLRPLAATLKQKLLSSPPIRRSIGSDYIKIPEGNILFWHGTSLNRAHSILESGFIAGRKKGGVYFSSNIMTSMKYAEMAAHKHSEPAIFSANYDLNTLKHGKEFMAQGHIVETHYVFSGSIATRIVRHLLTCHGLYSIGKITRFKDDFTDIAITQSSGNTGIAYWLNSFLDLDDSEFIPEDHPAVGQIKAWIDEQYANGRMIPIADEELLILAKEYLPEYF